MNENDYEGLKSVVGRRTKIEDLFVKAIGVGSCGTCRDYVQVVGSRKGCYKSLVSFGLYQFKNTSLVRRVLLINNSINIKARSFKLGFCQIDTIWLDEFSLHQVENVHSYHWLDEFSLQYSVVLAHLANQAPSDACPELLATIHYHYQQENRFKVKLRSL